MKKLVAMICAIVMVMALAVSAFAAGSPSLEVVGDVVTIDPTAFPGVTFVVAPEGYTPTTEWVVPAADKVTVNADGTVTLAVRVPTLAGVTSLAGYLLQVIDAQGNVTTIDLSNVTPGPDGTIDITIPAGCAFRVLAPAPVA